MNLPNILTLTRILLTVPAVFFLFWHTPNFYEVALGIFLIAIITDWLDGFLSRRNKTTSHFGASFDPLADKVLNLSLFIAFESLGLLPLVLVLLLLTRELLMTGIRDVLSNKGVSLPASISGKIKTVLQFSTIILIESGLILGKYNLSEMQNTVYEISFWLFLAATIIAWWGLLGVVIKKRKVLISNT